MPVHPGEFNKQVERDTRGCWLFQRNPGELHEPTRTTRWVGVGDEVSGQHCHLFMQLRTENFVCERDEETDENFKIRIIAYNPRIEILITARENICL